MKIRFGFPRTLRARLMLTGVLLTTLPLLLAAIISFLQGNSAMRVAEKESRKLSDADLRHIVEGVYSMIVSQQEVLQQKVGNDLNVARNELHAMGKIHFSKKNVEWDVSNQYTKTTSQIELPLMIIGNTPIKYNPDLKKPSPLVDKVKNMIGGTCTVFQRMNEEGDMLRVLTNVKTKDGARAIGTYIPAVNPDRKPNPVLQNILKGESFFGRAYVVNAWYITAYEPIFDEDKRVVGVLYVGVPEESAKSLRKQIMDIKIGKTGYVFVLNSKGDYVISAKGKRDGENIWNAKDSDGRLFIQSIVNKAHKLSPGDVAVEYYPWKNQSDAKARMKVAFIMYFKPWDWVIGAGSYEDEFKAAENRIRGESQKTQFIIIIVFIASLLISFFLWWVLPTMLARPIRRAADMLKDISEGEGDLTRRLEVLSEDEIGLMARYFNSFINKLEKIIAQIARNAEALAATSEEMAAVSTQLASGAEEMNSQATTIAGATEEMSSNIKSVDDVAHTMNENAHSASAAAGKIADNMSSVTAAVEESRENISSMASASNEMNSTINEIAQNAQKANETTLSAVESVSQASGQVEMLAGASQEINQIISVIMDIAEQTKLLALNATIEAARAGEAGKGFAVVANEVKDLAKQTNDATEDIKRRVVGMQDSTASTVESINKISEVIQEVNSIVGTIAAAVEEQNVTMKENTRNVDQVAEGFQEVTKSIEEANEGVNEISKSIAGVAEGADTVANNTNQASIGAADVARNISGVSDASKDTSNGAQQLNTMASDLADMSTALQEMMAKFKVSEGLADIEDDLPDIKQLS